MFQKIFFEENETIYFIVSFQLPKAVNAVDQKGETALEVALKARQPSLARTLVEHGANLTAKDSRGLSLLENAILKGDSYSAQFIIEQLENNGSTHKLCEPIQFTDNTKNLDNYKEFEGCTALHLVTKHDTENIVAVASKLLQAGIDPNLQDHRGW